MCNEFATYAVSAFFATPDFYKRVREAGGGGGGWVSVLFIYIFIQFFHFLKSAIAPGCSGTVNSAA